MDFIQQLINGLTIGSVYALVAIGFSVVYGALGLVNFAHGDVLMAGTFIAFGMHVGLGLPIARGIARAHGGDLRYVDEPGRPGACLRLTLPR